MESDRKPGDGVGAEDLGVGAEGGIVGLRARSQTRTKLPSVKVLWVESVFSRSQDLVIQLLHHCRIIPRGPIVACCVDRVDQLHGRDWRSFDGGLVR